ncbi:MAG: DUF3794 domain-containing protein [Clostridia bacterium]|nr:DUF3794 domain-containing protein [Clostridia bacterium]
MEINKENEYKKSTRRADVYVDSAAECVLPDYNGDVRKLLLCDAELHPSGKFFGDGEVELTGIIVYNVVYSDPDGNLDSTSFTSDYEYKVKCAQELYVDCIADTRVANVAVRLIGPRKISVKSSVVGSVTVIEEASVSVDASLSDGEHSPEIATQTVEVRDTVVSESVEREYAETVASIDGAIADEVSVLYSGADFELDDTSFADGNLTIEGELTLFAVVRVGEDGVSVYEREIELTQQIPFDEARADMTFIPSVSVVSLKDSVNATETGSDVVLSAIVEFSAVAEGNSELDVVSDAYMKECASESTYDDFGYCRFVSSVCCCENTEGSIPRSELDTESVREVILTSARAKIDSCEVSDGSATVSGEIKYSAIASSVDGEGKETYFPVKFSSEFSKNVNLNCQTSEKTRVEPKISLSRVKGYVDAERVYGSAKMNLCLAVLSDESERVLSTFTVREDLPFEKRGSRISVYYPEADETLFSVAKKYHTTAAKVALDNSITEAVSAGDKAALNVKKLIIF